MYSVPFDKKALIPALAGAGASLFFQRSGFLSLFFLVPLGYLAFRYSYRAARFALLFAVLGNAILTGGSAAMGGFALVDILWNFLFHSTMAVIFTWIVAPPALFAKLGGAARLVIGSCLEALLFTGIFLSAVASPLFSGQMDSLINALLSFYRSSGSDVIQNAMLDSLTPEMILDGIIAIMFRGGSLITCVFLFFVCRQISVVLAGLFRREGGAGLPLTNPAVVFRVPARFIWVLSASLLLVVVASKLELEIPEIILWNILILCGILYLAQGVGVLQFLLAKLTSSFARFAFHVLIIVLILSPGINAFFLAGLALLGIAENWVPFRVPGQNGPPSTPKAGDGGNQGGA